MSTLREEPPERTTTCPYVPGSSVRVSPGRTSTFLVGSVLQAGKGSGYPQAAPTACASAKGEEKVVTAGQAGAVSPGERAISRAHLASVGMLARSALSSEFGASSITPVRTNRLPSLTPTSPRVTSRPRERSSSVAKST